MASVITKGKRANSLSEMSAFSEKSAGAVGIGKLSGRKELAGSAEKKEMFDAHARARTHAHARACRQGEKQCRLSVCPSLSPRGLRIFAGKEKGKQRGESPRGLLARMGAGFRQIRASALAQLPDGQKARKKKKEKREKKEEGRRMRKEERGVGRDRRRKQRRKKKEER